jgi:hypothetical protein
LPDELYNLIDVSFKEIYLTKYSGRYLLVRVDYQNIKDCLLRYVNLSATSSDEIGPISYNMQQLS